MSWIERFKTKWNLQSTGQFLIVMLVFALTGTTVLFVKMPIQAFFMVDGELPTWFKIGYWIMIFPIYNVFLLCYGFLLGQFSFFWEYEKKMISRFKRKKPKSEAES